MVNSTPPVEKVAAAAAALRGVAASARRRAPADGAWVLALPLAVGSLFASAHRPLALFYFLALSLALASVLLLVITAQRELAARLRAAFRLEFITISTHIHPPFSVPAVDAAGHANLVRTATAFSHAVAVRAARLGCLAATSAARLLAAPLPARA